MHVHTEVSGHYDWAPCPPGTQITEDDVSAMRVKQMQDGSWQMRVELIRDTVNDIGIPESAITDRMSKLELGGHPQTRAATVREIVAAAYRQHLHPRHIQKIVVYDEGPNEDLYAAELTSLGITGAGAAQAMENYAEISDVEAFLNATFQARGKKETP